MARYPFNPDPLEVPVRVRYAECDPQSMAHHSAYVPWLELARCALLERDGQSYRELEEAGIFFVVARLSLRYRRPARFDDQLIIKVWTAELGAAKVEHGYEVLRGSELLLTAESTLACVDRDGRLRSIPEGSVYRAPG